MRWLGLVAVAVALSGCAGSLSAVNDDGGIIQNATTPDGALKTADAHCAKTGRTAKVVKFNSLMGSMQFECVQRSGATGPAG